VRAQPVSYPLSVVGTIATHAPRSPSRPTVCSLDGATFEQWLKLGRLVRLTGQE
jgi:hypothetical protein